MQPTVQTPECMVYSTLMNACDESSGPLPPRRVPRRSCRLVRGLTPQALPLFLLVFPFFYTRFSPPRVSSSVNRDVGRLRRDWEMILLRSTFLSFDTRRTRTSRDIRSDARHLCIGGKRFSFPSHPFSVGRLALSSYILINQNVGIARPEQR